MPIFVANSKFRRVIFRALVVTALAFSLLVVFIFLLELFEPSKRTPITQAEAEDVYLYYYSKNNENKVAFTFDDGPNTAETQKIMNVLLKHQVPATFFFIGNNVLKHPGVAKDVAAHGFAIGNHSFSHTPNVHDSPERLSLELRSSEMIIERITGTTPKFYRPPFLLAIGVDPAPNPYIPAEAANDWALALGYVPVGIDIDSRDWASNSKEEIVAEFKKNFGQSGRIITLFHDVAHTAEAVDEIIPWLKEQGVSLVPLSEVLEPPAVVALNRTLRPGDTNQSTGGEVAQLQWFLYKQGLLDPYAMSGVFDEATRDAVTLFQFEHNLLDPAAPDPTEVGVVDQDVRERIAAIPLHTVPAPAAAPSFIKRGMHAIEAVYLYLFSYMGKIITFVGLLALSLILVRTAVLIALLIYGKLKRPTQTPRGKRFEPLVSVLIPAYNEAENITSAIRSVVHNTYKKKEVIVIDDGSTDSTPQLVEEFCAQNPRAPVKLLRLENGGKARALTIGTDLAHGQILIIVDGDAALDKDAITWLVQHFADPTVGAVAGKVETAREKTLLSAFQALEYAMGQNIDKRATSVVGAVSVVPGPAGAWRKSAVLKAGGFPQETLVEDQDMTLTILRMGYRVLYEPRAITFTETPHTVKNFLKQRFRWVYGTIQCFWKHKDVFVRSPMSALSLLIMPNTLLFGILMPLTYPVIDTLLVGAFVFGAAPTIWIPIALFTVIDMVYALWGVWMEKGSRYLVLYVPLQRFFYRQLLYYTVIKSVVRAIEGRGARWNKFAKIGETERYFYKTLSTTTSN
jgi:cellulose synthase/poly-beta-1,6-N-acetylglucosamine synthase-like glycosyltransferase/peptidoglycan/xylan/chitin deacetylase (PgdA/CDA1 family)